MDFLDYINPLKHFTHDQYISFWEAAFNTVLKGFWARVLAISFLSLALWFLIRRRNIPMGLVFFLVTILISYGDFILRFLGLM